MSVKQMAMVWDLDLEPNHKIVLLAYADHADDDGDNVYPSLGRMAHKTGYSTDQIRRISRQLVEAGLMELVEKGVGRGKPHRYRLTLEKGSKLPSFKSKAEKVASAKEKVAPEPIKGGIAMPPEPSEPSVNHHVSDSNESLSGKPQMSNVVAVEKYVTDCIYQAMKENGTRLLSSEYPYHLGRAKDMLAKDSPTDAELETLPAAFVRLWQIKGKADAPAALVEMRRQKARGEILTGNRDTGPSYYEKQAQAVDKPRSPIWYASFYDVQHDTVKAWIAGGATHSQIVERLRGKAEVAV